MSIYNRDAELKKRLNKFLIDKLRLPEKDYYGNLAAEDFLQLKSVLSDINNSLTLKLTLAFSEWLAERMKFDSAVQSQMRQEILRTKPSTNGYDLEITQPKKVIAEVKCNVPINRGATYGSAQKDGIKKDIDALMKGKSKSVITPKEYMKFMVFLDREEIRQATEHLVRNLGGLTEHILFVEESTALNRNDVVYIVFVTI